MSKNGGRRRSKVSPPPVAEASYTDKLGDLAHWTTWAGVGVTAAALTASIVLRKKKEQTQKKKKGTNLELSSAAPQPFSRSKTSPAALDIKKLSSKKDKSAKTESGLVMIPSEKVSRMFSMVLDQHRQIAQSRMMGHSGGAEQGKILLDSFYSDIIQWKTEQLLNDARCIVCNFLFWYYRVQNGQENTGLTGVQADHIRYWANFAVTDETPYEYAQQKYDLLYTCAVMQKSIPHMRQFYDWICSEQAMTDDTNKPKIATAGGKDDIGMLGGQSEPRQTSGGDSKSRNHWALTKFQSSCILGRWAHVKEMGKLVETLSQSGGSRLGKTNYFLHYTLRAMEIPLGNPNYGFFYKMVDTLEKKFPKEVTCPPLFQEFPIYSFRYRNQNPIVDIKENSRFVLYRKEFMDEEEYCILHPKSRDRMTLGGIPNRVRMWGRVCQLVSPMTAASGLLPMVGSWSDSQMHLEFEWQYRRDGHLETKRGVLALERVPIEKKIKSTTVFQKEVENTGFIWEGTLRVKITEANSTLGPQNPFAAAMMGGAQSKPTQNGTTNDDTAVDVPPVTFEQSYDVEIVFGSAEVAGANVSKASKHSS